MVRCTTSSPAGRCAAGTWASTARTAGSQASIHGLGTRVDAVVARRRATRSAGGRSGRSSRSTRSAISVDDGVRVIVQPVAAITSTAAAVTPDQRRPDRVAPQRQAPAQHDQPDDEHRRPTDGRTSNMPP